MHSAHAAQPCCHRCRCPGPSASRAPTRATGSIPDQWYRNLGANLLAPVFQGGRLRSNVALAEAQLDEAVAAFGRSVVTAVNEVDAALTALRANRRRVSLLMGFTDEAAAEAALQEQRYRSGVGDYSTFLAASHHLLSAKATLAGGQRDLGHARLALHRALGGGWTAPRCSRILTK